MHEGIENQNSLTVFIQSAKGSSSRSITIKLCELEQIISNICISAFLLVKWECDWNQAQKAGVRSK